MRAHQIETHPFSITMVSLFVPSGFDFSFIFLFIRSVFFFGFPFILFGRWEVERTIEDDKRRMAFDLNCQNDGRKSIDWMNAEVDRIHLINDKNCKCFLFYFLCFVWFRFFFFNFAIQIALRRKVDPALVLGCNKFIGYGGLNSI